MTGNFVSFTPITIHLIGHNPSSFQKTQTHLFVSTLKFFIVKPVFLRVDINFYFLFFFYCSSTAV